MSELIDVRINKDSFIAGEAVKVKIVLHVDSKADAQLISDSKLRFTVRGQEETVIHHTEKNGDKVSFRDYHILINPDKVLEVFNKDEQLGKREYNAEYVLPENLPSSFTTSPTSGYAKDYCAVFYSVRVSLQTADFRKKDEVWCVPITVNSIHQQAPIKQELKIFPPDTDDVSFCGCFGRGSMTLVCALSKAVVNVKDQMTLGIVIENDSAVEVDTMEVTLFQVNKYRAKRHEKTTREVIVKQSFKGEVLPTSAKKKENVVKTDKVELYKKLYAELNAQDDSSKFNMTFFLRPNIRESFTGKLIHVSHEIKVSLKTKNLVTNPETFLRFKVLPSADAFDETYRTKFFFGIPDTNQIKGDLNRKAVMKQEDRWVTLSKELELDTSDTKSQPDLSTTEKSAAPSFQNIIKEMDDSYEDRNLIEKYINDESLGYLQILKELTPSQFGTVVSIVDFTYDQSVIARALAATIGSKFTCEHIASACRLVPESNRADIANATLPKAVDRKENQSIVDDCLSTFAKIMVEDRALT